MPHPQLRLPFRPRKPPDLKTALLGLILRRPGPQLMQHREEIPVRHDGDRRFDEQGDFFNGVRPFEVIVSHGLVAEAGVAGQGRADGADGLLEDLVDDEVGDGEDVLDVDEDEAEGTLGHAEGHAIRGVPPGAGHGKEVGAVEGVLVFCANAGEGLTLVFLGQMHCKLGGRVTAAGRVRRETWGFLRPG